MQSSASFLAPGAWHGGWYELAIRLGPRSDDRLLDLAQYVWSRSDMNGPYGSSDAEPPEQVRVSVDLASVERLFGVAHIPGWVPTVCSSVVVREEGGSDWFDLGLPLGALAEADDRVGGYPFDDGGDARTEWTASLDDWFAEIALDVGDVVPFDIALIGFEVSGLDDHLAWLRSEGRSTFAYVDSAGYHPSQR